MAGSDKTMDDYIDTFIIFWLKGRVSDGWIDQGMINNYASRPGLEGVFTSISVDWEFPGWRANGNDYSIDDGKRLAKFLRRLKEKTKAAMGKDYLISVAISGDPAKMGLDEEAYQESPNDNSKANPAFDYNKLQKPTEWHKYCDEIHVMAYDYMGAYDPCPGPQANLYESNDPSAVGSTLELSGKEDYSTAKAFYYLVDVCGIDKKKIHFGLPFYGRGWTLSDVNNGAVDGYYNFTGR